MSVQFIIGRAGSGKTHWCLNRITQSLRAEPLGPRIYWLVPRQATFQTQRLLASGSQIIGFLRARIFSLEELVNDILAECGGDAAPLVSTAGRQMIIGHLLRQHEKRLKFFGPVARQPGLAAEIDGTFSELERCGLNAQTINTSLSESAHRLGALDPALASKLHDLELLYTAYTQFLGQERVDPHKRFIEGLKSIEQCAFLDDADVYVDAFFEFQQRERELLLTLATVCRSVSIALTMDPDSPSLADACANPPELGTFNRVERAYCRLHKGIADRGIAVEAPIKLREIHRYQSADLQRLERTLVTSPGTPGEVGRRPGEGSVIDVTSTNRAISVKPSPQPSPGVPGEGERRDIHFLEAADQRGEVDAVARRIGDLVAAGGRYRDIAVLMRSDEDYQQIIDASFGEHGIPYFIDRRRTAAHHPLLRLVRAAVNVARNNWPHDAVVALLKTGLLDISRDEADRLENFVLEHGISHGMWAQAETWKAAGHVVDEDAAAPATEASIDAIRRKAIAPLLPLVAALSAKQTHSIKDLATAIFQLLADCKAAEKLVAWMADETAKGRLEQAAEHERVWAELCSVFDEMVELLGPEPMELADFAAIVDAALEQIDLALAPPTLDRVLVGNIDRTRTPATGDESPAIQHAFVLGLAEGQFPRPAREDSVFSDRDRRTLYQHQLDLDPDTQRQLLDETFLAYQAFTRASHSLYLLRPTGDAKGHAINPSIFWQQLRETFPTAVVETAPRQHDADLSAVATPRQLIVALMRWVNRTTKLEDAGKGWPAVYQWIATKELHDPPDAIDTMRYLSWKALSYQNLAKLSPDLAGRLFASPLAIHARQIELFRTCPYQHFLRYVLQLNPRQEQDVTAADISRAYHDVLRELVGQMMAKKLNWKDLTDEQAARVIEHLVQKTAARLQDQLMLSEHRSRYLLDRIRRTLSAVAASARTAAQRGSFNPRLVGIRYGDGPDAKLPAVAIRTPSGKTVNLAGDIDRVDVAGDFAAVLDYRLGVGPLNLATVYHGLTLQLLAHLLALEHLPAAFGDVKPAAALSVPLLRHVSPCAPDDALSPDNPRFHLADKPRGALHREAIAAFDAQYTGGTSDVLSVAINKDGSMRKNGNDALEDADWQALLAHVRKRIGQLADLIFAGRIDIRPYRMGKKTPCVACGLANVCRHDPYTNGYVDLKGFTATDALAQMAGKQVTHD